MFFSSPFSPTGRILALVTASALGALYTPTRLTAETGQQSDTVPNRQADIDIDLGSDQPKQPAGTPSQPLNAFIAAMLAVEMEAAAELSQVVADQSESSPVGQFAKDTSNQLKSHAERLRRFVVGGSQVPDSQTSAQPTQPQNGGLSETAQDIGQDIRDRIQERRGASGDIAAANDSTRNGPQGRLDRRELSRPRVVLPAIRQNLPQILELAGEALEQGQNLGAQPRSRIELLVAIAEETLNAKEQELAKYQGDAHEQAYLGMLVDAGLEIESAAVAAEPMATGPLQDTLRDIQQTAADMTEQARRRMSQGTDIARRDQRGSNSANSNDSEQSSNDGQKNP